MLCIPKEIVDKFTAAYRSGTLSPEVLKVKHSTERQVILDEVLGAEYGKIANQLFEQKLLRKNKQRALDNWVNSMSTEKGMTPKIKKDLVDKITEIVDMETPESGISPLHLRMLAEKRLGFGLTDFDLVELSKSAKRIEELKTKITPETKSTDQAAVDYGIEAYILEENVRRIKLGLPLTIREAFNQVAGTFKSGNSSIDNGFWSNQGIKTLFYSGTYRAWIRNHIKSYKDIALEATNKAIAGSKYIDKNGLEKQMTVSFARAKAKAEAYVHNLKNGGLDELAGLDTGIKHEEAFPSDFWGHKKMGYFGRAYRASAVAFDNAALRMRLDTFDHLLAMARESNMPLTKENLEPLGRLANSLTGRGKFTGALKNLEMVSREANVAFYSIRFLKSNVDALYAPFKYATMRARQGRGITYNPGEVLARRIAAKNITQVIGFLSVLYAIADVMGAEVQYDPRHAKFGYIKVGKYSFNPSGGLSALVKLAFRLLPTPEYWSKPFSSDWAMWKVDSKGRRVALTNYDWIRREGKLIPTIEAVPSKQYKPDTAATAIGDFFINKASPFAGAFIDIFRGRMYSGEPTTVWGITRDRLMSMNAGNINDYLEIEKSLNESGSMFTYLQNEANADDLAAILLSTIGVGTFKED